MGLQVITKEKKAYYCIVFNESIRNIDVSSVNLLGTTLNQLVLITNHKLLYYA